MEHDRCFDFELRPQYPGMMSRHTTEFSIIIRKNPLLREQGVNANVWGVSKWVNKPCNRGSVCFSLKAELRKLNDMAHDTWFLAVTIAMEKLSNLSHVIKTCFLQILNLLFSFLFYSIAFLILLNLFYSCTPTFSLFSLYF